MTKRRIIEYDRQIPGDLSAVAFGVQKSGTCFLTEVLTDILGDGVYKCHRYVHAPDHVSVFAIVRDFRDCMTSIARSYYPNETELSQADLFDHGFHIAPSVWALNQYKRYNPACRFISYETCIFNSDLLADALGFDRDTFRPVFERHTLEIHKAHVDTLTEHSPDGIWSVNHMRDGEIGQWRRFIPPHLHSLATDMFRDSLLAFGYE